MQKLYSLSLLKPIAKETKNIYSVTTLEEETLGRKKLQSNNHHFGT